MSRYVVIALGAMFLGISACGDPHGTHNCTLVSINAQWNPVQMDLSHTDSRSCPDDAVTGEYVSACGKLTDRQSTYNSNLKRFFVRVYNANPPGSQVGANEIGFVLVPTGLPPGQGPTHSWSANVCAGYTAGTGWDPGRDYPHFLIEFVGGGALAEAITRVDYWNGQI